MGGSEEKESDEDIQVNSLYDGRTELIIGSLTFDIDEHLAEWMVKVPSLGSSSPCNEFPMHHHDGMVMFFNVEKLRFIFRVHKENCPVREVVVPSDFIVPLVTKHFGIPIPPKIEECTLTCGDHEISLSLIN